MPVSRASSWRSCHGRDDVGQRKKERPHSVVDQLGLRIAQALHGDDIAVAGIALLDRLQPDPQHRAPVADVSPERGDVGQRIVGHALPGEVRARARPAPVARLAHRGGGDGVVLDLAHRRHQMRIVHRVADETTLEKIAAPALAEIDAPAVAPVRLRQRGAQPVLARGHEDEVDMIVHQAPGEAARALSRASGGEQREIFATVVIGKEDGQAAIAALRDVVGDVGDDDAGESCHGGERDGTRGESQFSIVSPELLPGTVSVPGTVK